MPTTFTSQLRFSLLGSGNRNIWGGVENNQVDLAEQAITGVVDVDVTSGTQVLTTGNGTNDQSRYAVIRATGSPGLATSIILPTITRMLVAVNDTSPGFPVTYTTSIGGVSVPAGRVALLWVDGDDSLVRAVDAPFTAVPEVTGLTSYTFASVPAGGVLTVKMMTVGTMVVGLARITTVPNLGTGTTVFDTSPSITSVMSPPYTCDFPVQINESGTQRECYLRIPTAGADWEFRRIAPSTFGVGTTRAQYGTAYLPFCYPLV